MILTASVTNVGVSLGRIAWPGLLFDNFLDVVSLFRAIACILDVQAYLIMNLVHSFLLVRDIPDLLRPHVLVYNQILVRRSTEVQVQTPCSHESG